ncbi:MAG: response regulator [Deltaproteobacteria bacterium]|nr:response regulator [Deltaproteobacteria bacterium]
MEEKKSLPRVLILDDDPLYLRVWEKVFRGIADCHYCLTNDPYAAMALLQSQPTDLVISDVVMPEEIGYNIATLARKHQPGAAVVLTTGYDCQLSRFNLQDPHFHILYKPYRNISDVQRLILHLLNRDGVFADLSEDSVSDNPDYPDVKEWRL